MLKLSSIKSFPLLSPCSPWFFLLNPGLELSYSLTAPVAFVELGVSAARCWLVIDPGGLLRSRRGRREDFLAIPGQRRINPLAVNELLGPLRRFAFRDDNAFPALGIHGPPRPQVQHGHIPGNAQRQHRQAEQVADDIVPGEPPHGPSVLT